MTGIVNRALVASAAAALTAVWSSAAFAADDAYGSPATTRGSAPQVIIGAPARDVVTYEEKGPNTALLSSGALMMGLSYGGSVVVAATSDRPEDQKLFIPLAGPWMDLSNRTPCRGYDCGVNETVNKVLLVTDGIFQGVGALQILGGFLFPETRTVTRAAKPGIHFTPTGGMGSVGIQAYGSF
jgi:hypothetical protein